MIVAEAGSAAPIRFRNKVEKAVPVNGRSAGYDLVDDLTIERGRHLSELDDTERRPVAVIGPEVAEALFGTLDPLGKLIRIDRYEFEIVGITKAKGKIFGQSQDRFVTVPIQTFQKYWQERGSFSLAVKSVDQASLDLAQQEARNILRARRHQRPGQKDHFGITTSETWLTLYRTLTGGIFVVSIGVAAISLFVGGIVIMNIMLVSVTERTREIGIRKALGARRRDILTQFLVESTTLSVTGGVVGILIGASLALLVGAVSPLPAALSGGAVALGVIMSTAVGVFFGSYPAARAARLDPIEALRYE
jgi:putative ABC transport system permease protein